MSSHTTLTSVKPSLQAAVDFPGLAGDLAVITGAGQLLQLDGQLCFALYAASLAMTKLYKPHLDALGLTYPQYLVMLVLWERDGQSVSELGARLTLDSGTLTPLLKRLQSAGWIDRRRSQADERRVDIHLTAAGAALRDRATAVPVAIAQASGCSVEDIADLTATLRALRQTLLNVGTSGQAPPGHPAQAGEPASRPG